jgi:hypothetical protein
MSRKSQKSKLGKYRSGFEKDVGQQLQPFGFKYEPCQVPYSIERKSTPDFVYEQGGVTYYIECKGYFRAGDTQKYRSVKNCLGENEELIFVLMNENQRVNRGSKLTMAGWCDKHEILWYNIDMLQELVSYVSDTRRN